MIFSIVALQNAEKHYNYNDSGNDWSPTCPLGISEHPLGGSRSENVPGPNNHFFFIKHIDVLNFLNFCERETPSQRGKMFSFWCVSLSFEKLMFNLFFAIVAY